MTAFVVHTVQISALKEELYSAEIAAVGSAQIEIQQIRDQLLQAQEAARYRLVGWCPGFGCAAISAWTEQGLVSILYQL